MYLDQTGFVTKADSFSLESLIAWLEKQPGQQAYDFYCAGNCLVGQWVTSIDPLAMPANEFGFGADFYLVNGNISNLGKFVSIANDGNCHFTFGAALTRARAALAAKSA